MLIDTHAHVQFSGFKDDADAVIQRALVAGVWVINVGSQINTSRQAVAMLKAYPNGVFAAVGLHPVHTYQQMLDEEESHFLSRAEIFDYQAYKQLAQHPKVVGIGECGLDYFRLPVEASPEQVKIRQREAFLQQINLALELDKVLCIHCRPSKGTVDAYEEIIDIISKITPRQARGAPSTSRTGKNQKSKTRFEVHCFTGTVEIARKFTELGGYLGINGILTFDTTGQSEAVVKSLGLERIILETDAPYLTPLPLRGKRNEPAYVEHTARKIAEILGTSCEQVSEITTQNARELFRI